MDYWYRAEKYHVTVGPEGLTLLCPFRDMPSGIFLLKKCPTGHAFSKAKKVR